MSLPTGTVAFLLTDIQGSTRLREEGGPASERAFAVHHRLLRDLFLRHAGHEVNQLGDGFLVAFERPADAVACAIAAQRALSQTPWPDGLDLRVRMAIHTGDIALVEGEYRGLALHYASRLETAAHGGQIICSEGSAVLLRRGLDPGVHLVDLGAYRLRDIEAPQRLFHVCYPEMPPEPFPPPRAEAAYGSQLPASFTRFFGRQAEIAWLGDTLLRHETRLVTMTGPGGTGKTRLSVEVARQLLDPFRDAVWFVPLQEVRDASLIAGAVVAAMKLPRSPELDPMDQAVAALARQPALLVLDNFEQVVEDGAEVVCRLLERAPMAKCLVTSRRTLDLTAEIEYFLAPLPTPGSEHDVASVMACESVRLFVDRAQAARPDFEVTPANAQAVGELCERLEGIPLALELAAARAQVLTPAQILSQLDRRLDFLATRKRDVPERHRTLRAAMDWSFESLPPDLQRTFTRLSAFRGGWTIEAAEGVCEEPNALECLERLRESSMVLLDGGAEEAGEVRFRLLETLREYGHGLLSDDEAEALGRRHAEHYLSVAEEAESRFRGPEEKHEMDRLERDHDNLRAALDWFARAPDGAEGALRLAGAVRKFWEDRGHLTEGRRHLDRALGLPGAAEPTAARLWALFGAGALADDQADHVAARALLEESLGMSRALGDKRATAYCLTSLSDEAVARGDTAAARAQAQEALETGRVLGEERLVAIVLCALGRVAFQECDWASARASWEEALGIFQQGGDENSTAMCLNNLGCVLTDEGDYAAAQRAFEEALVMNRRRGCQPSAGFQLGNLGDVARLEGDFALAAERYEEALAIARELGMRGQVADNVAGLGRVARMKGDYPAARALLEEALFTRREMGRYPNVNDSLSDLGILAAEEGDSASAQGFFAESLAISREIGFEDSVTRNLVGLSAVARREGDPSAAGAFADEALAIAERAGPKASLADCQRERGLVAQEEGDLGAAGALLEGSLEAWAAMGARPFVAQSLESLAGLRRAQGESGVAARLFGAAEALREAMGYPRPPRDREEHQLNVPALGAALGEDAFAAAWAEGRAMTWEEAVAFALSALDEALEPCPPASAPSPSAATG